MLNYDFRLKMGDSEIVKLMKDDLKKIREQPIDLGIKVIITNFQY